MKFDSYARFVKSPLYRECLLAEAEGRPLREPGSSRLGSPDATRKKPKLKPGKSLPLGVVVLPQGAGRDCKTPPCAESLRAPSTPPLAWTLAS